MNCPNCSAVMESNGYSGDVGTSRGVRGVDISWDRCPECGTVVDDFGNVIDPDESRG